MPADPSLLTISDRHDLADLLGVTYAQLTGTVFIAPPAKKYRYFAIAKKTGGFRTIKAPRPRLKQLQRALSDELYRVHRPHTEAAHGFAKDRSILSNAAPHVGSRYLLNVDLEDYFGSINFGRVLGLFMAPPFRYSQGLAAIIANICCDANSLPQGAPTSPVIANMLSSRLDVRLSALAHSKRANYTRYADDITFSFFGPRALLPEEIVEVDGETVTLGGDLMRIIEEEGFRPNYRKVRLASRCSRMEVTGITVNEFPNVRRDYVRQIGSMLYAWKKHGHDKAQDYFDRIYDPKRGRRSSSVDIEDVLRGRLAFLRSVRAGRGDVYNKLARRFNDVIEPNSRPLPLLDVRTPHQKAEDDVWVIATDRPRGTGVRIVGNLVITCAHVVRGNDGSISNPVLAFKPTENQREDYLLNVIAVDPEFDLAICEFTGIRMPLLQGNGIAISSARPQTQQRVHLIGMPDYECGDPFHCEDSIITRTRLTAPKEHFDVGATILQGMSGGPVLDINAALLGIIAEHVTNGRGNNRVIAVGSVRRFLRAQGFGERTGLEPRIAEPRRIRRVSDGTGSDAESA